MFISNASWITCLLLSLCFCLQVDALIPIQCAHNTTQPGKVCCPRNPHNGMVCGGPERGFCQKVYAPHEDVPDVFRIDDRLEWPTTFIQHACQCQPRFFGVSCERCWFGWTGPHCTEREMRIRRDIRSLSPRELFIFKDVVRRSWDWPSGYLVLDESKNSYVDPIRQPRFISASVQYYLTFLHYYGARSTLYETAEQCTEYGILNFNHDGVVFPTWHRYYNLIWERMLGDIAKEVHGVDNFAMPFWDWVGATDCDICTNKYIGGSGEIDEFGLRIDTKSMFHNLTDFCWEAVPGSICQGCQKDGKFGKVGRHFLDKEFPDQRDILLVLRMKNYYTPGEREETECVSFHMALEGYCGDPAKSSAKLWTHNRLHNMVQGSFQSTATATNDPLFPLHHTTIDKLFSMWYRVRKPNLEVYPNENVRPGHARDAFMIAIFPLARNGDMFLDTRDLGYDYEDPESIGNFAGNGQPPIRMYRDF